jgi:hypothetical protein
MTAAGSFWPPMVSRTSSSRLTAQCLTQVLGSGVIFPLSALSLWRWRQAVLRPVAVLLRRALIGKHPASQP